MWRSVLLWVPPGRGAGRVHPGRWRAGRPGCRLALGVVAPSDVKAAQLVEQIPIRSLPPLTGVTCRVKALRATCIGKLVDGTRVHARLRVAPDGSLVPFCHSSGDTGTINNIYCTARPEQYLRKGKVSIPSGRNIGVTLRRLYSAGLRVTIPTGWGTTSHDGRGWVVVRPAPGTRVPLGTVVTVRMLPVLGSPTWQPGHYVVPSVVGATLKDAAGRVQAAGLPWRVRATALPPRVTADLFAIYCVTAQNPAAGTAQDAPAAGPGPSGVTWSRIPADQNATRAGGRCRAMRGWGNSCEAPAATAGIDGITHNR